MHLIAYSSERLLDKHSWAALSAQAGDGLDSLLLRVQNNDAGAASPAPSKAAGFTRSASAPELTTRDAEWFASNPNPPVAAPSTPVPEPIPAAVEAAPPAPTPPAPEPPKLVMNLQGSQSAASAPAPASASKLKMPTFGAKGTQKSVRSSCQTGQACEPWLD